MSIYLQQFPDCFKQNLMKIWKFWVCWGLAGLRAGVPGPLGACGPGEAGVIDITQSGGVRGLHKIDFPPHDDEDTRPWGPWVYLYKYTQITLVKPFPWKPIYMCSYLHLSWPVSCIFHWEMRWKELDVCHFLMINYFTLCTRTEEWPASTNSNGLSSFVANHNIGNCQVSQWSLYHIPSWCSLLTIVREITEILVPLRTFIFKNIFSFLLIRKISL